MIANMKKGQSPLISVVDAVFRKIRNSPSDGTTMWRHHTGQLIWLKIIRHRMEVYHKLKRDMRRQDGSGEGGLRACVGAAFTASFVFLGFGVPGVSALRPLRGSLPASFLRLSPPPFVF